MCFRRHDIDGHLHDWVGELNQKAVITWFLERSPFAPETCGTYDPVATSALRCASWRTAEKACLRENQPVIDGISTCYIVDLHLSHRGVYASESKQGAQAVA